MTTDLSRFDGSFKDRTLEIAFQNEQWHRYTLRIRLVALITGLAYLTGIFSDAAHLSGTQAFYYMTGARILTFLASLFCVTSTLLKFKGRTIQNILFGYFVCISLSECFELLLKPAQGDQVVPMLLIIILFYYLIFPVPFLYSLSGSLGSSLLYSLILLTVHRSPLRCVLPTITGFLLVSVTAFYFVRSLNRANRSAFYALKELQNSNLKLQQEITEKEIVQNQLKELAILDELTQVYNRRHFTEMAQREMERAARTGQYISILFMDLDRFKEINDTWGHNSGDKVLKRTAELCRNSIRGLDIMGRFGGEEFVFLLPGIPEEGAFKTAERLRKCIGDLEITVPQTTLRPTASFGVATCRGEERLSLENLMEQADSAMYQAKKAGRNRVVAYQGLP